jgi:hypothetical protein
MADAWGLARGGAAATALGERGDEATRALG